LAAVTTNDQMVGSTGDQRAKAAVVAAARAAERASGEPLHAATKSLASQVLRTYAELVPAFRHSRPLSTTFSTVVSRGTAELSDPHSPVHVRGPSVRELAPGFFNLDPGKLTLAQLAADTLCLALLARHPSIRRRLSPVRRHAQELLQNDPSLDSGGKQCTGSASA
jgi:hypothetical protein